MTIYHTQESGKWNRRRSPDEFVTRLTFLVLNVGRRAVTLEKIGDGVEAKVDAKVKRGISSLVLEVCIGAASHEELDASSLTVLTGDDQAGVAHLVSSVEGHALHDELFELAVASVSSVGEQVANLGYFERRVGHERSRNLWLELEGLRR